MGITATLKAYGQTLQQLYKFQRTAQHVDPVVNYLSYWTVPWLMPGRVEGDDNMGELSCYGVAVCRLIGIGMVARVASTLSELKPRQ